MYGISQRFFLARLFEPEETVRRARAIFYSLYYGKIYLPQAVFLQHLILPFNFAYNEVLSNLESLSILQSSILAYPSLDVAIVIKAFQNSYWVPSSRQY